jgi:hypothetical protein
MVGLDQHRDTGSSLKLEHSEDGVAQRWISRSRAAQHDERAAHDENQRPKS